MTTALFAALSLGVANVFSVLMVQAESRGRPVVAGLTEIAYWFANFLCLRWAITHFTWQLALFCSLSAYLSTYFATKHGHEGIDDPTDARQDSEIDSVEARLTAIEAFLTPSNKENDQ